VRERDVAHVSALPFIDHLVDEFQTIRLLRGDLITHLGSRVQDFTHHQGAHR
jgi:hypothetical protein